MKITTTNIVPAQIKKITHASLTEITIIKYVYDISGKHVNKCNENKQLLELSFTFIQVSFQALHNLETKVSLKHCGYISMPTNVDA